MNISIYTRPFGEATRAYVQNRQYHVLVLGRVGVVYDIFNQISELITWETLRVQIKLTLAFSLLST